MVILQVVQFTRPCQMFYDIILANKGVEGRREWSASLLAVFLLQEDSHWDKSETTSATVWSNLVCQERNADLNRR